MAAGPYRDEPLRDHDRTTFSCGVPPLDTYLQQQARQDQRRKVATTYVLVESATEALVGYYTLSAYTIRPASLPSEIVRRFPRYDVFPAILIGRLAIDQRFRGKGLGHLLLGNALHRCLVLSESFGAMAIVVDAKDDAARGFYEHEGFVRFLDHDYRLYIPMRSLSRS